MSRVVRAPGVGEYAKLSEALLHEERLLVAEEEWCDSALQDLSLTVDEREPWVDRSLAAGRRLLEIHTQLYEIEWRDPVQGRINDGLSVVLSGNRGVNHESPPTAPTLSGATPHELALGRSEREARALLVERKFAGLARYFDKEWVEDAIGMALESLARGSLDPSDLESLKWKWIARLVLRAATALWRRYVLGKKKLGAKGEEQERRSKGA